MKRVFLAGAVLMVAGAALATEGYRATVCLANGNTVQTEFFGTKDKILDYVLTGKLNGQRVEYKLSQIKEIIFSEYETRKFYAEEPGLWGEAVIVSASGKRFTLTDCGIENGAIFYCYLDPVTESRKFTFTRIQKNIVSIKIGEHVGRMKKNPETGEFFPAIYSFDPFTSKKLIWANPVE